MSENAIEGALHQRFMLPRWRSPEESTEETKALRPRTELPKRQGWVDQLLGDFDRNPSAFSGRELIETAEIVGHQLPEDVLVRVHEAGVRPVKTSMDAATGNLLEDIPADQARIGALRATLAKQPRQALAWTELSRHYLAQGSTEKSEKAMLCALDIAPSHRYVLRSAARLFAHMGEPDHAVYALKKSGRVLRDPWLLSAEIALHSVMQKSSSSIKSAQSMLEARAEAPRHLAELAAAMGSLEHKNGRSKHAKRLFSQSLEDPNENSVAQVLHVAQNDVSIKVPEQLLNRPHTFEAMARFAFANGQYEKSLHQFTRWLIDEPFDVRPAVAGSCLSFDMNLAQKTIDIAGLGLRCDPHNSNLFNNRAVAYAYCGQLDKSFADIQNALRLDRSSPQLLATIGLLAYRSGADDLGLRMYSTAIGWLVQLKERTAAMRAYLYWLRESVRTGATSGEAELESVRTAVLSWTKREQESEVQGLIKAVEDTIEGRWKGLELIDPIETGYCASDLEQLESRCAVPEEAHAICARISESSVPSAEAADRHSR